MKIQPLSKAAGIPLSTLGYGKVFTINEVFYMKTIGTGQSNAIRLHDGLGVEFAAERGVHPVEGKFVQE